jgi:hypothetical protein
MWSYAQNCKISRETLKNNLDYSFISCRFISRVLRKGIEKIGKTKAINRGGIILI